MINSFFKKFLKDERGVAGIIGAIALPVMMGGASLAVDTTRYYRAKNIVMQAADNAAIAAAAVDPADRGPVAAKFFQANIPEDYQNVVKLKSFTFTDITQPGKPVVINYKIEATITPIFGSVIGIDTLTLTHDGQAVRALRNLEVVINLPVNGTMCSFKDRDRPPNSQLPDDIVIALRPDPACTDFNMMKEGVKDFAKIMFYNKTISRFKFGIVPYNYLVKMPNISLIPPLLQQNEFAEPAFFQNFNNVGNLPAVMPLSSNEATVNAKIDSLQNSPEGVAWSRTNLPTLVSALMLDPGQKPYFPGGETPAPFYDVSVEKVVILITDGSNIGCCFTNWEPGNFRNQYVYFHDPDNSQQIAYCNALKKAPYDVRIYSIILNVEETDPGGKEINNVFARCASGSYLEKNVDERDASAELKCSQKKNCYNVKTALQLKETLKDIAQNYYIARTSQ